MQPPPQAWRSLGSLAGASTPSSHGPHMPGGPSNPTSPSGMPQAGAGLTVGHPKVTFSDPASPVGTGTFQASTFWMSVELEGKRCGSPSPPTVTLQGPVQASLGACATWGRGKTWRAWVLSCHRASQAVRGGGLHRGPQGHPGRSSPACVALHAHATKRVCASNPNTAVALSAQPRRE